MIHAIRNVWLNGNEVGIEVTCYKRNQLVDVRVDYADAPGREWDDARLNDFGKLLQAAIDDRSPRSELPDDDPAKTADPAEPGYFWDGDDIVTRSAIVKSVVRVDDRLIVSVGSPNG